MTKGKSRRGRPVHFRVDQIAGTPIRYGLPKKRRAQICILAPTEHSRSRRRNPTQEEATANTFLIRLIRWRTGNGRFLPPIQVAIGAPGKSLTSASSIIV